MTKSLHFLLNDLDLERKGNLCHRALTSPRRRDIFPRSRYPMSPKFRSLVPYFSSEKVTLSEEEEEEEGVVKVDGDGQIGNHAHGLLSPPPHRKPPTLQRKSKFSKLTP